MAISVRRATPADAPVLHDVAARTFALACPPGTTDEDVALFVATQLSAAAFARYTADPDRVVLLAEADGTPVGYTMLVRGAPDDPDVRRVVDAATTVELSKCYVLADAHGTGAATALMDATLAAAAATGAQTCWLGVNQLNARAARFYAKHGFAVAGTKRFRVGGQWHDDHVRIRSLKPNQAAG